MDFKDPELPMLRAARHWAEVGLSRDGSIFSDAELWTEDHLAELERYFVDNPQEGGGRSFIAKLREQLEPSTPGARKLASEMLWVVYLPMKSGAMRGVTKRDQIQNVWEWSGDPLPLDHWTLSDEVLDGGVSHPGTAYQTHRWREFRFFIDAMLQWKREPSERRAALLRDPWRFASWLDERKYAAGRQLRHLLVYLLFPRTFERSATSDHKKRIVEAFGEPDSLELGKGGSDYKVNLDRAVLRVRERLTQELGVEQDTLDFYRPPLVERWLTTPADGKSETSPDPEDIEIGKANASRWVRERFGNARVWLMSAGEGARLWREFQESDTVSVGWDYLGDFREFPDREAIHAAIAEQEERNNPYNSSLAVWQFTHEMREGDVVIVKRGWDRILGWGKVSGPYRHETEREEYRNLRPVSWQGRGEWRLRRGDHATAKVLTEMAEKYPEWVYKAFHLIEGGVSGERDEVGADQPYTKTHAMEGLFLEPEAFTGILDALGRKKNVILQGPPGVGKTFIARRLAYALIGRKDPSKLGAVQFHQSYAYEDFIQGWRPNAEGGFVLRDGAFLRFCQEAERDPESPHVFIIDEINRANLSRVLGELMMLIESDKRGPEFAIPLTYSPETTFSVPPNVHILGMMNTADRSLALVDYALRRRFTFVDLRPAFGSDRFRAFLVEAGVGHELIDRIDERMMALNKEIRNDTRNLGPGFEVGHSYFVPGTDDELLDESWYQTVVREEVAPLLREYWFDRPDEMSEHVGALLR